MAISELSDQELLSLIGRQDASRYMPALIAQESGGRAGVMGPQTAYGRAQGMTQMLPDTAQAMARKLNMPWRPDLMTAATPEAAQYQQQLGQAYLQEGLDATGNPADALRYYHGGPNRDLWGPKTDAYAKEVMARTEQQPGIQSLSDEELLALVGEQPKAAKPAARPGPVNPAALPQKKPTASAKPPGGIAGAAANFLSGIPLADEAAGASRMIGDVVTGKSKVDPLKTAAGLAMSLPGLDPVAAQRILSEAGWGAAFDKGMKTQRGVQDAFAAAHPNVAALSKGTGNAFSAFVPAGKAADLAVNSPRVVNMARGAVTAGLTAAGYAATDRGTIKERAQAAAAAARDPLTLALGAGAGALAPARAGRPKPQARSAEELQAAKQAAYQAADQAGVQYAPQAFDGFVNDVTKEAAQAKLNPMRHPKAASMLEELQGLRGSSPTLTEMDQLRQVIRRDVANSTDEAEAFFGKKMIAALDGFIDSAPVTATGDAGQGAALIKKARGLNTQYRKVQDVTEAVESARLRAGSTGSGGNVDNAIRQNLRRVLENGKNFTPEEQKALESIVLGGKGQNTLRLVGKLSPSGNGLMAALNLGSAASFGGAGAVPGAAGIGAKWAADAMTQQKVNGLLQLISSEKMTPAQASAAQRQLQAILASSPQFVSARSRASGKLARAAGAVGGSR